MADVTYYVVLPFVRDEDGELVAEEGVEAPSAFSAQRRAQAMLANKAGAIAFSRTGAPSIGEFQDAVILGRYGEVPSDLSVLMVAD
jgi:hypothetical protein